LWFYLYGKYIILKDLENLEEESLDQPIGSNKDGKELRVEDIIADEDSDFVEDVLKQESLLEVRKHYIW